MTDGPDIEASVRRHVADALADCGRDRIASVERFHQGERHLVFKVVYVTTSGAPVTVVVRVASEAETRDCPYAGRGPRVPGALAGRGAPRLLNFQCASQWIDVPTTCLEHVPGTVKLPSELRPLDL